MARATVPKRPTRDEFELEDLGNQLVEAKEDGDERALMYGAKQKKYTVGSRRWIRAHVWFM